MFVGGICSEEERKYVNDMEAEWEIQDELCEKIGKLKDIVWDYMSDIADEKGWEYIWGKMDEIKQNIFLEYAGDYIKDEYMKEYYKEY